MNNLSFKDMVLLQANYTLLWVLSKLPDKICNLFVKRCSLLKGQLLNGIYSPLQVPAPVPCYL
jgi:hypothetical protein